MKRVTVAPGERALLSIGEYRRMMAPSPLSKPVPTEEEIIQEILRTSRETPATVLEPKKPQNKK